MLFLIKDENFLKEYNKILDEIGNSIKIGSYSEPVYIEKYLKTKRKSYRCKINTTFHDNGMPKKVLKFLMWF